MSHQLINLSHDLQSLQNEGFEVKIKDGHLLISHIPYVNTNKEIVFGTLVCALDLSVERTAPPASHVMYFAGDTPCDYNGIPLSKILHSSQRQILGKDIIVNHLFSSKPSCGRYADYYEKVTTYQNILSSQAEVIDSSVTARTFNVIESKDEESVFNYIDTNSTRAEILAISAKLENLKIAIIGTGGTGSYILDFVAKTPVNEIHLFDGDEFQQHNAFRTPGAPSIAKMNEKKKKVDYLHKIYSYMHKGIKPHPYSLTSLKLKELEGMSYIFICIDKGMIKKSIIEYLVSERVPFSDVGMGLEVVDTSLRGSIRVTSATVDKNDHLQSRISYSDGDNDEYSQNIQIAELNALNAALAVVKWKKHFGFYCDLEKEHHTIFNVDNNQLENDEIQL